MPSSIDELRTFLVATIAAEAGCPPDELATDVSFTAYGLDSMAALAVGMEIEDACGLSDLSPSLLWENPTVDTLAVALWALIERSILTGDLS